ncbi:hypothetical protein EDB89DRAFT_2065658 [Lactarius sanguifluus]|nr:hypothetical protein EDB89DRAFT_2065658 [Lactarius sanguifluus]
MPWVPALHRPTVASRRSFDVFLRPSTQGLLTRPREELSTASSKVPPAYSKLPCFVLTVTKERSLHAAKVVVRKKLGLGHDAPIELAQLRDGKKIDLEDDDDFEAFRALTNSSLHATVAVTIPPPGSSASVNALGEKRRRPNELPQETYLQGGAESSASASITGSPTVQSPSIDVTGTRRPRKRRKVAFNGDLVTSETTLPAQPPPLSGNDVGPSSSNPALASPPMAPQSSKTTERTKSSPRVPTTNSGKLKSNVVRATHQDEGEAVVPPETSRKRGKKKDDPPKGRESLT